LVVKTALTISKRFEEVANKHSNKTALIFLGKQFSYIELKKYVDDIARALYDDGIRKQDKVILYMGHCPQWIIFWLALQKLGAVVIPVTNFYGDNELRYIADDSGATSIICMDTNYGYVNRVLGETPLKRAYVTNVADHLPSWKIALGKVYGKIPEGDYEEDETTISYKRILKKNSPPLPEIEVKGEDIAELLYTGGTTGLPKGIPISNDLFVESMIEQRRVSENLISIGEDTVIQGAPLYHILGQAVGIGAILAGDSLILLPRVNLDALFDHIERYKATTFFGAPMLYRMILEHDRVDYYDLSSIKYYFCGGDVLPIEVENRWYKKFNKPIHQGYGATETCGGITLTYTGRPFPKGTVGQVLPTKEVRLVNPETLEDLPKGAPGELLVHSPNMVKAYWNKPEETEVSFVTLEDKLWYKTGDIVLIDQDGFVFFEDRSADVIKHKGYRVAASRIEAALQSHPAVVDSCAVGVPDPVVGERIKAFVVLKEDVKGISASELIGFCRKRIASYELPQYIEFRDMLPKSKVGKLLRKELRATERRKQK